MEQQIIKKKILYITNLTSPYRVNFFNLLGSSYDLTVLVENIKDNERECSWLNRESVYNFKIIYLEQSFLKKKYSIVKYLTKKYDLIIMGGYSTPSSMIAIEYMRIKKIPFILNADGAFINYKENQIIKIMKKHFISSAKYWICTSESSLNYFTYYGANPRRIFKYRFSSIFDNDIKKVSENEKSLIRNELGIPVGQKVLITVGQMINRKGYDILFRALSKINDKNLSTFIVGGSLTSELSNLLNNLKLENIILPGFLSKEDLYNYYQASDIFVFASRYDIWGLVVNEAMAFGLPVISSDMVGSSLEMIKNEDIARYCLFKNEDPDDLAYKIKFLFENRDIMDSISKKSLAIAKEFTIEKMVEDHVSIFEEIFKNG